MAGQQGFTEQRELRAKPPGMPVGPHSINAVAGNLQIHALFCTSTGAQLGMLKASVSSFLK